MAWSRSACCPVRPNRASQRDPEVGQVPGPVGVVGRGGVDGLLAGGDGLVQVRLLPGALEPDPQRVPEVGQPPGPVGVVGRGGVDGLGQSGDGLVQVRLLPGALEPGLQRACRGWTASPAGRGGRPGWRRRPRWPVVMAWSRSACCPVCSNRVCSAFPRLDRYLGRSGWPAGVASTASENRVMAWSRSACCPVRPNRVRSALPRLDRYPGRSGWPAGVASTASWPAVMACVQVRLLPGALEPGPQRVAEVGQVPGPVGVAGRGGVDGLAGRR